MACRYETPSATAERLRRDLDQRTEWLCTLMSHPLLPAIVESINASGRGLPGLKVWWAAHQAHDRRRKAMEGRAMADAEAREARKRAGRDLLESMAEEDRLALEAYMRDSDR